MDLLDAISMRMLPLLDYPYGEEFVRSIPQGVESDEYDDGYMGGESIYETSNWY